MHSALWPSRGAIGTLPTSPSTLAALGIAIVTPCLMPQAASALSLNRLNQVAQDITVRIEAERPGSGVIIHRQDDRYTVLTARHLVAVQDQYAVVTPDGERYPISFKAIQAIPDTDLALIEFRSRRSYSIAKLASYAPTANQYLFLSGFPAPSEGGVSEQIRLFIPGQVVPFEQAIAVAADPISQGYRLFYSNMSEAGMRWRGY
jgi:serine protease Do